MGRQRHGLAKLRTEEDVPITVEALKAVMPKHKRHTVTKHLVDELNTLINEPEARRVFRENLLSYVGVLHDPNVKMTAYIDAVRYVSYKLMGNSNQESWIKTFPHRYQRLLKDNKDEMFLRATVSCYNKNKTVNMILEQTLIPSYVLNQDLYQQAINVQAELMLTAKSEKVRADAADSLMTHLRMPETTKVSLNVNVKQDDSIKELREVTLELVRQQRLMLESGTMNAKQVAEGKLLVGEFERVE